MIKKYPTIIIVVAAILAGLIVALPYLFAPLEPARQGPTVCKAYEVIPPDVVSGSVKFQICTMPDGAICTISREGGPSCYYPKDR